MKKIYISRDCLWPTLEEKNDACPIQLEEKDCKFNSEKELNEAIKYAWDFMQSEDERRKSVENKAALFISSFSVAVTILLSMIKDLIFNMDKYPLIFITVIVVFIGLIIIYLCRAVLYAIDALKRKSYKILAVPEILYNGSEKTHLFLKITNIVYSNMDAINEKVDAMTMAQEFFKCAVRTAMVLVFILIIMVIVA